MPAAGSSLVLVGQVTGAFGVKGEVRVHTYTREPEGIAAYGALLDESGKALFTPKRLRTLKGAVAVTAPEVTTREAAEALKGTRLYVPRARLPPPDEDEFYAVDLIGCAVVSADGASLGYVAGVHDFGAGEVLEITGAQTLFLPFTRAAAPCIDLVERRIVADPEPELPDAV